MPLSAAEKAVKMETLRLRKTRILVECGILIAMATVLGFIPIFQLPMGGSITLCSTMPLVVLSFRHGWKWGMISALAFGGIQMMLGFKNVLYAPTLLSQIGCALLDYLLAYMAVGFACIFSLGFSSPAARVVAGTVISGLLRYFCSFLSGILIWGGYAPEGTPVWLYSLTYNGSFMVPEIILTTIASVLVLRITWNRLHI